MNWYTDRFLKKEKQEPEQKSVPQENKAPKTKAKRTPKKVEKKEAEG